jgi:LPXTG-site transpeptidase (sortase) family protein
VFNDLDGDLSYDPGEDLPGVDVLITDSLGNLQTVTTDANGFYALTVPAGSTLVDVDETDLAAGLVLTVGTETTTVNVPAGGTAQDVNGYRAGALFDPPSGYKVLNAQNLPELEWRIVWINDGNAAAINVQAVDSIPAGTTYVPGSLSCQPQGISTTAACVFDAANNRIFWQGSLGPDLGAVDESTAANELVLVFRISVPGAQNQVMNQASALTDTDADGSFGDETTPASESFTNQVIWNRQLATATPTPTGVQINTSTPTPTPITLVIDPAIAKSVNPTRVFAGQTATYTLVVTNNGSAPATNVVVTDTLSSLFEIVQASATRGSADVDGQTVTFGIGTVNPGEVITLTILIRVSPGATATGDIPNVATLAHLSSGVSASENSNTVILRILGDIILPVTGEEPTGSEPAGLAGWIGIVNLTVRLIGLVFLAFGISWLLKAGRRGWGVFATGLGLTLLLSGISIGAVGAPLSPRDDPAPALVQGGALTPALTSAPTQPLPVTQAVRVIVPSSTPEPVETLPAYPTPTPPPASALAASPAGPALDMSGVTRIVIPSLAVEAEVKFVPFDGFTWNMKGLRQEVAWLGNTSWPGLGSNTVLAGHVVLKGGVAGPFYEIDDLTPGTEIIVYTEQSIYIYHVREQFVVDPTDVQVTTATGDPQLTLITCTAWDSNTKTFLKRRVVISDLVTVVDADSLP